MNIKVKTTDDLTDREYTEYAHDRIWDAFDYISALEQRIIALERGFEWVLRRMEASGQADDEPGWYGRPE